eukprot:NODE_952_length_2925_cov_0.385704.p2 type:complete len:154 gc:universal NODE_952_length_2925_cov_0.385704:838-377(-)
MKIHPDADGLYISQIEVGSEMRTIVSGLAKFIPMETLLNTKVMILSNLKTSKLRGVESQGMVLCASNEDHTQIEVIRPPTNAKSGDLVVFEEYPLNGVNDQINGKSKTFTKIMSGLKCDSNGNAVYMGENGNSFWKIGGNHCVSKNLKNCTIG